jgi:hypothetical protein
MKPTERDRQPTAAEDTAIDRYVSGLKALHGKYAGSVDETRELVDASMGRTSLTELLYKSRQDSPL